MPDLDDVIDRLRTLIEELREASEDGRWYIVEDVIEELEELTNELQGIAVKLERQAVKTRARGGGHG
jgi:rRNA-processing protein FCF1